MIIDIFRIQKFFDVYSFRCHQQHWFWFLRQRLGLLWPWYERQWWYTLVNLYFTMERSTILYGKNHNFNGHSCNSYVTNYQRVNIHKLWPIAFTKPPTSLCIRMPCAMDPTLPTAALRGCFANRALPKSGASQWRQFFATKMSSNGCDTCEVFMAYLWSVCEVYDYVYIYT